MTDNHDNNQQNNQESLSDMLKKYSQSYGADAMGGDLGLKGIRHNPAWYLTADTIEGAIQAATEILQNGVDESAEIHQLYVDSGVDEKDVPDFEISIKIDNDDTFTMGDTGRGVPADYHEKFKRPALEVAFEEINIGAKGKSFVEEGKSAYKTRTIGKHGSGAACANATSDFFEVVSYVLKDDKIYAVRWEEASKVQPTTEVGPANGKHGTHIRFRPSREVFRMFNGKGQKVDRFYNEEFFIKLLKEYAFNTDNIIFKLEFQQPDGSYSLTEIKSSDYDPTSRLSESVQGEIYSTEIVSEEDDYELKLFVGFSPTYSNIITTSNMLTLVRGTHTDTFKEVFDDSIFDVEKAINEGLKEKGYKNRVTARNLESYGVYKPSGYISVYGAIKMGNPQYTSQAKEELRVPHILESLKESIKEKIDTDLNPIKEKVVKFLVERGLKNVEANIQLDKIKEMQKKREENKKRHEEVLNLKDANYTRGMGKGEEKIKFARNPDATKQILHLVEGDTASKQLLKVRDIEYHTVVSLDQRPPNVYNHKEEKLVEMEKYQLLYNALFGSKDGNLKAIVIATDYDPDGDLICSYLIAFIHMFFPHYLYQGRVFVLETPKFAAVSADNDIKDFLTHEEREEFIKSEKEKYQQGLQSDRGWTYAQYKGLGSIPKEILSNLVRTGVGYIQVDPETIDEGMVVIQQMLADKQYKRHYVMSNYATDKLNDYLAVREEIIRQQEVDFDINHIEAQFNTKPNLTDIKKETPLEILIREHMTKNSLTDIGQVDPNVVFTDKETYDDDTLI